MGSGRRYGSTDMQHDLFRSGHDLDLRSNFPHNFLMSHYTSFDASRQEEHDAGKMNVVPLLSQKLLPRKKNRKNGYFSFLLSGGQTVYFRSNLRTPERKSVKRTIDCAFPRRCQFVEKNVEKAKFDL